MTRRGRIVHVLVGMAGLLASASPSLAQSCVSDDRSLCVLGRFRVSISYSLKGSPTDPRRSAGRVAATDADSGLFYFPEFGPENWEFLAKGVDLCATANPLRAFLVGAATDREYEVEIVDTVSGDRKTFYNPLGNRPILFRTAFACRDSASTSAPSDEWIDLSEVAAAQDAERDAQVAKERAESVLPRGARIPGAGTALAGGIDLPATTPAPPATPSPCLPSDSRLCLLGGRFAVEMSYRLDASENYRAAQVVPAPSSPDSGLFYFPEFGPTNWEVLVKTADLCGPVGFFVLIAAAATDRDFRVDVTDVATGETRAYANRQGEFPPLFREAFASCDAPPPPVCGDGVVDPGEACDDGNDTGGDGCEADCKPTPPSAHYVDNRDGTITDTITRLTWEKKTANLDPSDPHDLGARHTWSAPGSIGVDGSIFSEFLPALNGGTGRPCFAGHCDWRLPTPAEIRSILDCSFVGPPFSAPCIDPVFGPTTTEDHWTSASARAEIGPSVGAIAQPFFLGGSCSDYGCLTNKAARLAVRAVRGGSPPPPTTRWRDLGDGTVSDAETGLVWEKKTAPGPVPPGIHDASRRFTWSSSATPRAQSADGTLYTEFLPTLNGARGVPCFAGHCDWRVPTLEELASILEEGCIARPCIHPVFGPTVADGTWVSSFTDYGVPDGILVPLVGFYDGSTIWDSSARRYFARAVRSASP